MTKNPFLYYKTSPEIIQLTVMTYIRFPLSLRNIGGPLSMKAGDCFRDSDACFMRDAAAVEFYG